MKEALKYEMEKGLLERFTDATNRSKGQTSFLYDLLEGNFEKLVELEEKLKNNHCSYCPADRGEVEKVLAMKNNKCLLNLEQFLR
jgi:hypothetical protein